MKLPNTFKLFVFIAIIIFNNQIVNANQNKNWSITKIGSKSYVSLSQFSKFYNLHISVDSKSNQYFLENNQLKITITTKSKLCYINTIKFFLIDFPKLKNNKIYISTKDLIKIFDPVIRPTYNSTTKKFSTVIIDPGHGGKDAGAVNSKGTEAKYNLIVAHKLKFQLNRLGYKVIMTRHDNTFIELKQRAQIANKYKNAIFISIHFNASNNKSATGIETFLLSPTGTPNFGSKLKQSDFRIKKGNKLDYSNIGLATAIHAYCIGTTKRADRGIKYARFSVLTNIEIPGILFEGGFMSNPIESTIIDTNHYQSLLAKSIALGINKFNSCLN